MAIQCLPLEIFTLIFEILTKLDLKSCRHVSRSWNTIAASILFNSIQLKDLRSKQLAMAFKFVNEKAKKWNITRLTIRDIQPPEDDVDVDRDAWVTSLQGIMAMLPSLWTIEMEIRAEKWSSMHGRGEQFRITDTVQKVALRFSPYNDGPPFASLDALELPSSLTDLEISGLEEGGKPVTFLDRLPHTISSLTTSSDFWSLQFLEIANRCERLETLHAVSAIIDSELAKVRGKWPCPLWTFRKSITRLRLEHRLEDYDMWHAFVPHQGLAADLSDFDSLRTLEISANFIVNREDAPAALTRRLPPALLRLCLLDCDELVAAKKGSPRSLMPIVYLLQDGGFTGKLHLQFKLHPNIDYVGLGNLYLKRSGVRHHVEISVVRFPTQIGASGCFHQGTGIYCSTKCLPSDEQPHQVVSLEDPRAKQAHGSHILWSSIHPFCGFPEGPESYTGRLPRKLTPEWLLSEANADDVEMGLQTAEIGE